MATAQAQGLAVNSAEVVAVNQRDPDSTPNNNIPSEDDQDTAEIQTQLIDLFLNKTVSNASPNVGELVDFVITVGNQGPSTATGVMVTESLPSGVTLQGSSPSQGSFNTTSGIWTIGALSPSGLATLTLSALVNSIGTGTNSAQVTAADQGDIDSTPNNNIATEDDQDSATFTAQVSDLSPSSRPPTTPHQTWVTEFRSRSSSRMRVRVPQQPFVSRTSYQAAFHSFPTRSQPERMMPPPASGRSIHWLPTRAASLTIIATVDSQGAKTNKARVISVDQADPDSTPGNDIESEDDQSSVIVTPPLIDLSLTKSASPARPSVGQNLTYTITIANAGPQSASGVEVTDVLPPGLSLVSSNPSSGSYEAATGIWSVGSIASGGTATLQVVATVNTANVKNNTAQVTAANEFDIDSTPDNNIATEDDQASVTATPASADLSLSKTVNDASPNLGNQVTFTLTANNAGPDDAANIVIQDTLPAGMTFVSSTPSLGSYDSSTGQWTLPSLANGS